MFNIGDKVTWNFTGWTEWVWEITAIIDKPGQGTFYKLDDIFTVKSDELRVVQ